MYIVQLEAQSWKFEQNKLIEMFIVSVYWADTHKGATSLEDDITLHNTRYILYTVYIYIFYTHFKKFMKNSG